MVEVVRGPIDDDQAEKHFWPSADFCGLDLQHGYPYSRFLNLVHWMQTSHCGEWSQFITFASFRVQWRESFWIYVFKRSSSNPESLPERGVSLMSERYSLKRENHFISVFSPITLSVFVHGANVSGGLRCFRPSIELKDKNMLEVFQLLHLALHFQASTAPLTNFKWQNLNM